MNTDQVLSYLLKQYRSATDALEKVISDPAGDAASALAEVARTARAVQSFRALLASVEKV